MFMMKKFTVENIIMELNGALRGVEKIYESCLLDENKDKYVTLLLDSIDAVLESIQGGLDDDETYLLDYSKEIEAIERKKKILKRLKEIINKY